jgi:hypothetical protein
MKKIESSDVVLLVFLMFWLGTCAVNRAQERECMVQCKRPIQECEKICSR